MLDKIRTVSIIGSGNVATQMAFALKANGIQIQQVYSRTFENAEDLASKIDAHAIDSLGELSRVDLLLFSIKDDVYTELLSNHDWSHFFCAHTAGSVSIRIFENSCINYGVFYPLQTFSKNKSVSFAAIPILVEGSSSETEKLLYQLATCLSKKVEVVDSESRMRLHVSAVFACNYANHCMALAEQLLNDAALSFDLIKPLVKETLDKALLMSPKLGQTGPAVRDDKKVINKHLDVLKNEPCLQHLYKELAVSIQKFHN